MRLRVLGTDGGIGKGRRTSCFLIDDDILIDAGTGLGDLEPEILAKIDNIFLSHVHMDHIACLPLMMDTVVTLRETPITVRAPGGAHENLFQHIFNGIIWPDFTRIPTPENPVMRIVPLTDEAYEFDGRKIGTLPVNHHGEAVGYWLDSGSGKLVFTGDTGPCDSFWKAVNALDDVHTVIIECSFPNAYAELARKTGHLAPALWAEELPKLEGSPAIFATHMKPMGKEAILKEIPELSSRHEIRFLERDQIIEI